MLLYLYFIFTTVFRQIHCTGNISHLLMFCILGFTILPFPLRPLLHTTQPLQPQVRTHLSSLSSGCLGLSSCRSASSESSLSSSCNQCTSWGLRCRRCAPYIGRLVPFVFLPLQGPSCRPASAIPGQGSAVLDVLLCVGCLSSCPIFSPKPSSYLVLLSSSSQGPCLSCLFLISGLCCHWFLLVYLLKYWKYLVF